MAEIPCSGSEEKGCVLHKPLSVRAVRQWPPFRRTGTRALLALVAALVLTEAQAQKCVARSGERTAALVELYTSEGCSSCPPADRWLSSLGRTYRPEQVVPLALHVDYWDYIGWKDPYAKREFSQRQRRLSQQQRLALVYTPQVLVQGRDFRGWAGSEFALTVARINAQPPRATLELEILGHSAGTVALRARATVVDPGQTPDAALYIAAYENRLESTVTAGENEGRRLSHDRVVLEWQGPFDLGERQVKLALLPKAKPADSGVAAFVQSRGTAEVLQALTLATCAP